METRRGQLLIAGPMMLDPNFEQTLVLLLEDTEDGTLGVVLNRAMEVTLCDAWEQVADSPCEQTGFLYQGGPVEGPMVVLHPHEDRAQHVVAPGLAMTTEAADIAWLMEHNREPLRAFAGYAGWGRKQLEHELEVGSWLLTMPTLEDVFDPPDQPWLRMLERVDPARALLVKNPTLTPTDPSMN